MTDECSAVRNALELIFGILPPHLILDCCISGMDYVRYAFVSDSVPGKDFKEDSLPLVAWSSTNCTVDRRQGSSSEWTKLRVRTLPVSCRALKGILRRCGLYALGHRTIDGLLIMYEVPGRPAGSHGWNCDGSCCICGKEL